MKNSVLKMVITAVVLTCGITVSAQEDKRAAAARKQVVEAENNLNDAKADSARNFEKFVTDARDTIKKNQESIAELKSRKTDAAKKTRKRYDKKVEELEQKNAALKEKIEDSAQVDSSKWAAFKREFKHDLDKLGLAIKDIGVKNTGE